MARARWHAGAHQDVAAIRYVSLCKVLKARTVLHVQQHEGWRLGTFVWALEGDMLAELCIARSSSMWALGNPPLRNGASRPRRTEHGCVLGRRNLPCGRHSCRPELETRVAPSKQMPLSSRSDVPDQ